MKYKKILQDLEAELSSLGRKFILLRQKLDDVLGIMKSIETDHFDSDVSTGDLSIKDLSVREKEIFGLIGQGKTVMQIAKLLKLSRKTVEAHRQNIKQKLGLEFADDIKTFAAPPKK